MISTERTARHLSKIYLSHWKSASQTARVIRKSHKIITCKVEKDCSHVEGKVYWIMQTLYEIFFSIFTFSILWWNWKKEIIHIVITFLPTGWILHPVLGNSRFSTGSIWFHNWCNNIRLGKKTQNFGKIQVSFLFSKNLFTSFNCLSK